MDKENIKVMNEPFYNRRHQLIGILEDGIFEKKVRWSKHYMHIYKGWGIDLAVLNRLLVADCSKIRIDDVENGLSYETTPSHWKEKGILASFDGAQVFLPEREFDSNRATLFSTVSA